jgi:hypothetical protein
MNTNSYTPGTTGGNKEWLDGTLTILEPEDTPFTSMVSKDNSARGTFHECVADRLRAARTAGSREGTGGAGGNNKAAKRQRFGAYLHRFIDTFGVTDVQQAVSEKGGNAVTDDEYADAKAKCVREVKRDIEAACLSAIETKSGGDAEMQLRGAFTWLASSQTPAIPSEFQTPAAQRLTGVAGLIEVGSNSVNSVLKSLAAQGGSGDYQLFAGNDYVEDIDLFTRTGDGGSTQTRYQVVENGAAREITMMVRVFQTSFGRVTVHPDQFVRIDANGTGKVDSCLIADMQYWKMSFLEALHAQDDEETAGGMTGFVKAIGGLFCTMPRGNAFIYNS